MKNYICGCDNTYQGKGLCEYHYKAIHRRENLEKYHQYEKKSHQKNKEKRLAYGKSYWQTDNVKQKSIDWRRNHRYGKLWELVFIRDHNQCVLCGSTKNLCIDHIVPVLQGGKSTMENMRILCMSCNRSFHNKRTISKNISEHMAYQLAKGRTYAGQ